MLRNILQQNNMFSGLTILTRVARWHISKPKIPIWVNFGGSCNGRCWYILRPFGLIYGHLVYFTVVWYIFPRFGIFYLEKSGNPAFNGLPAKFNAATDR
jgi:hypothetical protein